LSNIAARQGRTEEFLMQQIKKPVQISAESRFPQSFCGFMTNFSSSRRVGWSLKYIIQVILVLGLRPLKVFEYP